MKGEERIPKSAVQGGKDGRTSAVALTLVIALMIPSSGLAFANDTESAEGGLCEHHTQHTEACGYSAPTEGAACSHEHDNECGYVEAVEGVVCDKRCAQEDDSGNIIHSPDCAYIPTVEGSPCNNVLKMIQRKTPKY